MYNSWIHFVIVRMREPAHDLIGHHCALRTKYCEFADNCACAASDRRSTKHCVLATGRGDFIAYYLSF